MAVSLSKAKANKLGIFFFFLERRTSTPQIMQKSSLMQPKKGSKDDRFPKKQHINPERQKNE